MAAPTGRPAVSVTLRGQVTEAGRNRIAVNLEDPHGVLTGVVRSVTITPTTVVRTAGMPPDQSAPSIRPGYRVTVRGYQDGAAVVARSITLYLPPLEGVVAAVQPGLLAVRVPGHREPVTVTLTPHTSYYLGQGTALAIKPGTLVRVFVRAGAGGKLVATSVVVNPAGSGS
jgi:hypothetical protein